MSLRSAHVTGKAALLQWCRDQTRGYKNVNVQNFTTSWCDGLAFCALLHSFDPTLIGNFDTLKPENKMENVRLAFDAAERLGITKLIDVEDVADIAVPEPLSMMTYISQLYHYHAAHTARVIGPDGHRRTPSSPPTMEDVKKTERKEEEKEIEKAKKPNLVRAAKVQAVQTATTGEPAVPDKPVRISTGSLRGQKIHAAAPPPSSSSASPAPAEPTSAAAPKLNRTQSSIAELVARRKAENEQRGIEIEKRKKEEWEKQQQKTSQPAFASPTPASLTAAAASSVSFSAAPSSSVSSSSYPSSLSATKIISTPAPVSKPVEISLAPPKSPRRSHSQSDIKATTSSASTSSTTTTTTTTASPPLVTSPSKPAPVITPTPSPTVSSVDVQTRSDEERRRREERWKSLFDRETQETLQQKQTAAQIVNPEAIIVKCLDDGSMFKLSTLDSTGNSFNGFTGQEKKEKPHVEQASPEVATGGKCALQ